MSFVTSETLQTNKFHNTHPSNKPLYYGLPPHLSSFVIACDPMCYRCELLITSQYDTTYRYTIYSYDSMRAATIAGSRWTATTVLCRALSGVRELLKLHNTFSIIALLACDLSRVPYSELSQ